MSVLHRFCAFGLFAGALLLSGCSDGEQIDVNMTPVEKESWEQHDLEQQQMLNDHG